MTHQEEIDNNEVEWYKTATKEQRKEYWNNKTWTPDTCNYCGEYCDNDCPGVLEYIREIEELDDSF